MNAIIGQEDSDDVSAPLPSHAHRGTAVAVLVLSPDLHVLFANEYARDLISTDAPGEKQDSATGGLWKVIKEVSGAINQARQGWDSANRCEPHLVARLMADLSGHRLLLRTFWLPDLRESSRSRILILLQEPEPQPGTVAAA